MQNNKQGIAHTARSDARGLGNTVPNAPPGLSRKGLGVKGIAHAVRSDARGLGNTVPNAPLGLSRKGLGVNQHRKVLALSCAAPSTCTTLGFRENFNILPLNPLVAGDNHLGDAFAGNNLERLVG